MHPHAISVLGSCCAPESERTAGLPVTGRRSRESLPAARRGESDMASAVQKIKLSPSRDIPFNKLVLSQSNVRRVKAGVSIEQLAESIAQRTLLQSLSVRAVVDADGQETGMYEVPAGGRRYRALGPLVKQKRMGERRTLSPASSGMMASPRTIPLPRMTSGSACIRSISSARFKVCATAE